MAARTGLNQLYGSYGSYYTPPASQWAAWSQEALQDMLPTFRSNNNVLQSVIELKDFRSTAKGIINKLRGRHSSILSALTGVLPGDKTLKQLSKMYLSYSFAWRPLANDIISLSKAFDGFRARWNDIMRRANAPQQSYWGRDIDGTGETYAVLGSGTPSVPAIPAFGKGDARWRLIRIATDKGRYHASLRYHYPLPSVLLTQAGRLLALRDYLGTDLQLKTVWEVTPWSFFVDWFVNVGRALERLDVMNVQFKTEILEFCHSVKFEKAGVLELSLGGGPNGQSVYSGYTPIATAKQSYYERRVGLPDFRAAISTSGLSANEFLLGGALVGVGRRQKGF